jgi:hypothetical protein
MITKTINENYDSQNGCGLNQLLMKLSRSHGYDDGIGSLIIFIIFSALIFFLTDSFISVKMGKFF